MGFLRLMLIFSKKTMRHTIPLASTTLSNQYSLIRSLSGAEGNSTHKKIPTLTSRDFCF